MSAVFLCELKFLNNLLKSEAICKILNGDDNNKYLGAAVRAMSLSFKEAVIVYCDPLWHVSDKIKPKPSGKCYMMLLNDENPRQTKSIEFCPLSAKSFDTCMGGFSVDLSSQSSLVSGIEMIVGMPHMIPYGGVKIVRDPFGISEISEPKNGRGKYFNYGYAVSMTSKGIPYVSSPLSDQYGPNVTNIMEDIQLTSPDNSPFSSFGLSLITLSIDKGKQHAVVVGAPFHSIKSLPNVGKVYIFCSSNSNRSIPSGIIYGQEKDEFLGYSLANIGDINYDGNDDLAISSPFLSHNDARGFVAIYTINDNGQVSQKRYQILKTNEPNKIGIFGIALTGGYDIDFNGWPDIVVASTQSNSIELFSSREQYAAQCSHSLSNYYENEVLTKNQVITIEIFLTLMDFTKDHLININFLKNFKLISQIDPNVNVSVDRFELYETNILIKFRSDTTATIMFTIKSLHDVRDMNLTNPVIISYRFVEDCENRQCDNYLFPLIKWEKCFITIPIRKYICSNKPTCDADISVSLNDNAGEEVIFGLDLSYHRSLEMKIINNGPTDAKDINFKILTFQNLRINKIWAKNLNINDMILSNQTEAVVKLDQLEIDMDSNVTLFIDLYFVDVKDPSKMKYENNSILIQLFSDVFDANVTNNIARINYIFIYEPNISLSGSPKKDTVVDARNRSELIQKETKITVDKIGPRLTQTYIVDNIGKNAVSNVVVRISLPIHTSDNFIILYLFDKIRGINRTKSTDISIVPYVKVDSKKYPCHLPTNYINPFKITGVETHETHLRDIDTTQHGESTHFLKKRSLDEIKNDNLFKTDNHFKMSQGKMHRIPVEIIQCDRHGINLNSPICADIYCEIPLIPPYKQAKIQINAWLMASTFFKKQISDIMIYTTLNMSFEKLPLGVKLRSSKYKPFNQYQQFIFNNVKPKIIHIKALWPIIVGIVIGILILAILIVAMYKCGFFKRNKRRRHFRSKKSKHNDLVILHPEDIQNASVITFDTKFTSHSTLIQSKD